jgi:hypothetical protein
LYKTIGTNASHLLARGLDPERIAVQSAHVPLGEDDLAMLGLRDLEGHREELVENRSRRWLRRDVALSTSQ